MSTATARISPPPYLRDTEQWKQIASKWMLQAAQGHLSNVGTFTCASGTAATVLSDRRIGFNTVITLVPRTAHAATEVATLYVSSQSKGAATVTHSNGATGDRTFNYSILG